MTDQFSYPLSARAAEYLRNQEKKANKSYAARRQELQKALQNTQQYREDNHHHKHSKVKPTQRDNEDVIFISQNVRSLGLSNWPTNKDKVNNWFNAWKQELTQNGLTAISIQETRLQDTAMAAELESMWCRIWGLKPNEQQPWTFWSTGPASKGVAILVNPRNRQNWIPVQVPATTSIDPNIPTIDSFRCIVVQLGPWRLHNVYAPNHKDTRNKFFDHLRYDTRWVQHSSILLGDMNCVENGMYDRQDPKAYAPECDELTTLLMHIETEDALWVGRTLPISKVDIQEFQVDNMTCYPMHSPYGSRLDRIYIPKEKASWVYKVTTKAPSVYSDHKQVTLVLKPPTATRTKRQKKLYDCTTEDFLAMYPILSHLLTELEWPEGNGAEVPKRWDDIKKDIRHRLQDLQRIRVATRKEKKEAFLQRLGKAVAQSSSKHTSGASKLQKEIKANLAASQRHIGRKKGESIAAGIKCDARFFKKIATKWTDPTIRVIDPPPGVPQGSLHDNMTAWWLPVFTATYKQPRRGKTFQKKVQPGWFTGIAKRLPEQEGNKLLGPVTLHEVKAVIRKMARNKATGPDGLPMDLYKDLSEELAPILQRVTQSIMDGNPISPSMQQANIIPLKKKGNSTSGLDYRPIMLLNADYKIVTGVITERLKPLMHWVIREPQFGFVPGENMMDAIDLALATLKTATDMQIGAEKAPLLVLLDFAKAYDSLNRLFLFDTMTTMGFPPPFMQIIRNLHENTTARFLINGMMGPNFNISRGIRQGDPLAPFLFLLAIEVLLTKLNLENIGQHYTLSDATGRTVHNSNITAWGMVDDTVIQLQRGAQLKQVLPLLDDFGAMSGLMLQKTKSMAISLDTGMKEPQIRGIPLLQPGETTRYLGIQIGHGDICGPNWERALAATKTKMGMAAKITLTPVLRAKALQAIVAAKFRALAPHVLPSARIVGQWQNMIDNFFWEGNLSILGTGARRHTAAHYLELPQAQGGVGLPNLTAVLDDCTTSKVLRWSLRPHSPNTVVGHAQLQNVASHQVTCLPIGTIKVTGNTSWHHGYNTLQQRLKYVTPSLSTFEDKYTSSIQAITWYWSSASRCHWATQRPRKWIRQCNKDNPFSADQRLFLQHTSFQLLQLPYPASQSFISTIQAQGSTSPTSGWFECTMHDTQRRTVINIVAGLKQGILQLTQEPLHLFPLQHQNLEWRWHNNSLEGTADGQMMYQAARFRIARPIRLHNTTTDTWSQYWPRQSPLLQRICLPDIIAGTIQEPGQQIKRAQKQLEQLARSRRHDKALLGRARTQNKHRVLLMELKIQPAPQRLPNLWHKAPGTSHLVWFVFRYQTLRLNTYVPGFKGCQEGCGATNTLFHTLWECPHAQLLWTQSVSHWRGRISKPKHWKNAIFGGANMSPPKHAYDQPQFVTLQKSHPELVHKLLHQGWRLVVQVTLHHLWSRFNHRRYPQTPLVADLQKHIVNTFASLSKYQAYSKRFISSAILTILASCYNSVPLASTTPRKHAQMNFDGASQGNPGPGGCGAVLLLRLHGTLQPIAVTTRYIADESNTNNSAEYQALLDGFALAEAHHVTHLSIIGDSELVVNQTIGLAKVNFQLREKANQVQRWMTKFQRITIRNVPRAQNQAADFLSKLQTKGEAPLINHPVAGWEEEANLLTFLQAEHKHPP